MSATESVRVWREQNEALRALYNPVLNEPVPQRLLAAQAPRRRWPYYAIAAGAMGVSFGLGWLVHGYQAGQPAEAAALPRSSRLFSSQCRCSQSSVPNTEA